METWGVGRQISRRALLTGSGASVVCAAAGFAAGRTDTRRSLALDRQAGKPTETRAAREAAQPNGVFFVETHRPLVALSFDDGPDPAYTPSVLQTLDRFEAKATFFVVGVNAAAYPELVAQELAAGHRVGNHTFDHGELELLAPKEVATEIDGGEQAIVDAGAPKPTLFRPPKGFTDDVVGVFADADRYRTIFWGPCVERFVDHAGVRPGVDRVLAQLRPGTIVLAHDGGRIQAPDRPVVNRDRTMEALPLLLEGIRRKGLQPVDVATLLAARRR